MLENSTLLIVLLLLSKIFFLLRKNYSLGVIAHIKRLLYTHVNNYNIYYNNIY